MATGCPARAFFPDAKLNFAENLLAKGGEGDAIVFRGEDKVERRLSWDGTARHGLAAAAGSSARSVSARATVSPP
jgi:acyl-coenzyme A synthetase/AMP-(fatty) acid ligase